jgi:hypothetical protein
MTCSICGRPLREPASLARGIGPVCAAARFPEEGPSLFDEKVGHEVRGVFDGTVRLCRHEGRPVVNLEQTLVLHSPTGFEWGYAGSGPADLALNILLRFVDRPRAEELHQAFKERFLAPLPEAGGIIARELIEEWIDKEGKAEVLLYRSPAGGFSAFAGGADR